MNSSRHSVPMLSLTFKAVDPQLEPRESVGLTRSRGRLILEACLDRSPSVKPLPRMTGSLTVKDLQGRQSRYISPQSLSFAVCILGMFPQLAISFLLLRQLEVAHDGISISTSDTGSAAECVALLEGLSVDQLRWIFSSFSTQELREYGWDVTSVPFLDDDESTHLWSELHEGCAAEEILISGSSDQDSGAYIFFTDTIFRGKNETFNNKYYGSIETADLISYLESNGSAISYFSLSTLLTTGNSSKIRRLEPVAIYSEEEESFVKPKAAAFEDNRYPLARRLYLSLLNDEGSLASTRSFVAFGLSLQGTQVLKSAGFWPIHDWEKILMATRAQIAGGISRSDIAKSCGPSGGNISIAGSSTVYPIARVWSAIYQLGCAVKVEVAVGGSSAGAGRVCADLEKGTPVDIGDMSRPWAENEALESRGFLYDCVNSDRSAIQIDVAIDGLTVASQAGGEADRCMKILGGLTIDQLRWIYSNYTDNALKATGWDPISLKNSDGDSNTHLWSELDAQCSTVEIRIAGADDQSGTYAFFKETVMADYKNGESFDVSRPASGYFNSDSDDSLVAYVREYEEAVSYFGYSYYFNNEGLVASVPIQNKDGTFVAPIHETISDGSYNPLSRRIYMNLWNDAESLRDTVPFVQFGIDSESLLLSTGYAVLPEDSTEEMERRLDRALHGLEKDNPISLGLVAGIVVGVVVLGLLMIVFVWQRGRTLAKGGNAGA
jgi:phosphate transport system substrate-binding protein